MAACTTKTLKKIIKLDKCKKIYHMKDKNMFVLFLQQLWCLSYEKTNISLMIYFISSRICYFNIRDTR